MIISAKIAAKLKGATITDVLVSTRGVKYDWENQTEVYEGKDYDPITMALDNGMRLTIHDFMKLWMPGEEPEHE